MSLVGDWLEPSAASTFVVVAVINVHFWCFAHMDMAGDKRIIDPFKCPIFRYVAHYAQLSKLGRRPIERHKQLGQLMHSAALCDLHFTWRPLNYLGRLFSVWPLCGLWKVGLGKTLVAAALTHWLRRMWTAVSPAPQTNLTEIKPETFLSTVTSQQSSAHFPLVVNSSIGATRSKVDL